LNYKLIAFCQNRAFVAPQINLVRNFGVDPQKRLVDDEPTTTSWNKIFDRTADVFFMTEIFRALWLTLEVAMKPKVEILVLFFPKDIFLSP
jgi:hypothetical protein